MVIRNLLGSLLAPGFPYPAAFWRDIKGRSPLVSAIPCRPIGLMRPLRPIPLLTQSTYVYMCKP